MNTTDPLEILRELVRIPSVNPMGGDATGPEYFETRLSEHLLSWFESLGVPCERIEVAPGRFNVLARFESSAQAPTLLWDAHQDTVPVAGMTVPPFEAVVEANRLYGRGACDVKGGMAAMLAAFARLVRERPAQAAHVVISCTCDEECTRLGIDHLVRYWSEVDGPSRLLYERPDAAIAAEPTDLNVVVAHRGATRWQIVTHGRACHSSRPQEGINAIYRMAEVLRHLQEYAAWLDEAIPPHPLCGPPTFSVGRIEGGVSVNTVPDRCVIEVDRRCIPGEDGRAVVDEVRRFLAKRVDFEVEMIPPSIIGPTLSDENNGPLAESLLRVVADVAGPRERIGVPFGTHASSIAAAGVPAVVFGPGSIHQAHTPDEWLPIDELHQAAEILFRHAAEYPRMVPSTHGW